VLTGCNSSFVAKGFRDAETVFPAHSGYGAAILGSVYDRFDRNTFGAKDRLDVEWYRDAGRVHAGMLFQDALECLFLAHFCPKIYSLSRLAVD